MLIFAFRVLDETEFCAYQMGLKDSLQLCLAQVRYKPGNKHQSSQIHGRT